MNSMDIIKANWQSHDGRVTLDMPFYKVDTDNRTVSGFASVDNLDQHNDVITAECAYDAFERFRGNLREMHQHVAVGKVLSFWQKPLYDEKTDKIYNGVYVTAYVSTGAQDTWEKVLDGTLSGFSIGGNLVESEDIFDKELKSTVRVITKMDLFELSLVDNPANQLANVVSVQKVNGENVATGIAVDVEVENVYWCEKDHVSTLAKNDDEAPSCVSCSSEMNKIGWVESNANKTEKMRSVVNSYVSKLADNTSVSKGGVDMTEEITESVEETVEKNADAPAEEITETVEKTAEEAAETVEKSEDVTEEAAEAVEETTVEKTVDFESIMEDMKLYVADTVTKAISEATAGINDMVTATLDEFKKSFAETDETMKSVKGEIKVFADDLVKRIDAIESTTAVKKSAEPGRPVEKNNKGLWAGAFLNADEL